MKVSKINFQLFLIKKPINYFLTLLFISFSIYCQTPTYNQTAPTMDSKYGVNIKLTIHEEVQFEDDLLIVLTSFSHKHSFLGGPTKATAHITLFKNKTPEEKSLSVHGIEGKPDLTYDTLRWNEYEFHLKAFNYDESIEIIVHKVK
ncbi:hypothetical protein ACWGOQ_0000705 [Aquimarina sp. M1]